MSDVAADLDAEALLAQFHEEFSPIGWHWGHCAWQREVWLLRKFAGGRPLAPEFDHVFDTARCPKALRGAALPDPAGLRAYSDLVDERVAALRGAAGDPELEALLRLAQNHERQHAEIALCVRLLGGLYRSTSPVPAGLTPCGAEKNSWITVVGGVFPLGVAAGFGLPSSDLDAWDNEGGAHEVLVRDFSMQRYTVSEDEWLAWMREGGYERAEDWSEAGWAWREAGRITAPEHWQRGADGVWRARTLVGLVPVGGARPIAHVSWFEADAYARSVGARLPTEAEWEYAASWDPVRRCKRRFPWGQRFEPGGADVDQRTGDWRPRGTHPQGASAWGIEDLCGGVWEWVADTFEPYPGFRPGWYAEYSAPWFGARHRVARGGSRLTAPSNARTTFRNWYEPRVRQPCLGVRLARDA